MRSLVWLLAASSALASQSDLSSKTLASFTVDDGNGNPLSLAEYSKGVVVIVNVASQCGYTESNYQQLQQLYMKYNMDGFNVLAFPCNQFGNQEPGPCSEIKTNMAARFGVTFPILGKVDVNGPNAHELFVWLKHQAPLPHGERQVCADDHANCADWAAAKECTANPVFMNQNCRKSCGVCQDIRWNFNKFLVVDGQVVRRYSQNVEPNAMEADIIDALYTPRASPSLASTGTGANTASAGSRKSSKSGRKAAQAAAAQDL